jgi:hypothetical protein
LTGTTAPGATATNQDLEDFIKRKAPEFKNLKIEDAEFFQTTLQLLREGETKKTARTYVNINGWKSDEIKAYVTLKLGVAKK